MEGEPGHFPSQPHAGRRQGYRPTWRLLMVYTDESSCRSLLVSIDLSSLAVRISVSCAGIPVLSNAQVVRPLIVISSHSYLVAETPFGPLENPNTRIILIGGDHKTQARYFVNPEAIQRTEVCIQYIHSYMASQKILHAIVLSVPWIKVTLTCSSTLDVWVHEDLGQFSIFYAFFPSV